MQAWLLAVGMALGLGGAPAAAAAPDRPKLVVVLVIDQMRADYVDRFGARWTGGLHRLLTGGAWLRNARYPYLATFTCPGHATIGTGSYPHTHGMVLNKWYDRKLGKAIDCTDDPGAKLVGHGGPGAAGGDSARNLLAPTLGDQMKARLPTGAKVVSLSIKARSAIDLGGHRPDAAVWFDGSRWVSSTAFTARPLPWLEAFVAAHPVASPPGPAWDRLLPAKGYAFPDDQSCEKPPRGWTRTFPHPLAGPGIRGLERWATSPAIDAYLGEMAAAAVKGLELGKGPGADLLAISFSSNDFVGHSYGPCSQEVEDVLAHLDVTIGKLLAALDAQLGKGQYALAFTSDHGVSQIPERAVGEGKDAGRILQPPLRAKVEAALAAELGPGKHLADVQENEIYLAPGAHRQLAARPGAIGRVLAAVRSLPGVADAFESSEIADPARVKDPLRKAAALGFNAERSGDLMFIRKPDWTMGELATNHGSPYEYDQHVPLVFYGKGIKPGRYDLPASPADVAPTLGQLIGVNLPKAEGRVVTEVLSGARRSARARGTRGGSR